MCKLDTELKYVVAILGQGVTRYLFGQLFDIVSEEEDSKVLEGFGTLASYLSAREAQERAKQAALAGYHVDILEVVHTGKPSKTLVCTWEPANA